MNTSVEPIAQSVRRVPFQLREKVDKKLDELLAADIIEEVPEGPTSWISPLVIIPKPDGDIRVCVDIRDVETVIFQTLPLPLPHLSLPLPPTKKLKTTVDNFFYFGDFVACLLLHFIFLRKQKPSFTAITLPSSLELIVSIYSVFVFLRYQNSC